MLSESCFRRVDESVSDVDRLLCETSLVAVGEFRCPPTHPRFGNTGPIRNYCFVFPRTSSVIEHDGGDRFVGDQTRASLYNAGQQYQRARVSPEGDWSDYFVVNERVLREAVESRRGRHADAERQLFQRTWAPVPPDLYFRQRRVFRASRSGCADAFEVESSVMGLLDDVLECEGTTTPAAAVGQARLVERTQMLLARRFADALTLHELASELAVSPFHLCRVFRRATGQSLHQYREQLRLRAALGRLEGGEPLIDMALDLGYSSHSHFTAAFRRAFGVAPSRARG